MKKQLIVATGFAALFAASAALNVIQFRKNHTTQTATLAAPSNLQSEILCDVAKSHLKEHWSDQRNNIEKIIRVVNNPNEMAAKLKADLEEIGTALQLTEAQRTQLKQEYEKIFSIHVRTFRDQLNQKPDSNWPGMFETLKAFYQTEDELIQKNFGSRALEKFRQAQATKRTPTLALIGQYAGIPWDNHIQW